MIKRAEELAMHMKGLLIALPFALLIALLIAAPPALATDPDTLERPEGQPSEAEPDPAAEQEATREATRAEREALRERLREQRESMRGEDMDMDAMRQRMETRRAMARGNWWEVDEVVQALSLTEAQQGRLAELNQTLQGRQREQRDALGGVQRQLNEAVAAGDRDAVTEHLRTRAAATSAIAEAENEWLLGLMDVLSAEQLATLQSDYPRVLGAMGRGDRFMGGMRGERQ